MNNTDNYIVFFDGVCHLCNKSVQFIIRFDTRKQFKFASLQSDYAASLPAFNNKVGSELSTVVLKQGGRYYFKSTAALKIARHLVFPISIAYLFIVIPTPLRNIVYDWIANNRYKWFGRRDECWLPTPELRKRFLD